MDSTININEEVERLPLKGKGIYVGKDKVNTIEDSFAKADQGEKNRVKNNGCDGNKSSEEIEDEISVKVKKEMLDDEVVDLGSHNCQMEERDNYCQMEIDEVTFDTGEVYTVENSEEGNESGKNKRKIEIPVVETPVKNNEKDSPERQVAFVTPNKMDNPYI